MWSGGGSAWGGSSPPPSGVVWVRVFLRWFPPGFGYLWVLGILIPMFMIKLIKHLNVSLVGRRVSSAHVPGNDYRFIDCRATIFVTVVA